MNKIKESVAENRFFCTTVLKNFNFEVFQKQTSKIFLTKSYEKKSFHSFIRKFQDVSFLNFIKPFYLVTHS